MSELELVDRIRRMAPRVRGSGVVRGIGDDCAVFRQPGSTEDLVFTTDLLIENVHFEAATHPAAAVGHKALARGLSDIAAMGAEPRFFLLSLALPEWAGSRWIGSFYDGLLRLAKTHRVELAGGDLSRAERVTCDIVVCGSVARHRALRRDTARAGDAIYVSGQLGASALGLERKSGRAWQRHLYPEPRVALGRYLGKRLRATAAMDLSDGLSIDLHRLADASGLTAEIEQPPPRFPHATLAHALHGGEDYELLFTLPPEVRPPAQFKDIPLTRIGTIQKRQNVPVRYLGTRLPPLGYDHFRKY